MPNSLPAPPRALVRGVHAVLDVLAALLGLPRLPAGPDMRHLEGMEIAHRGQSSEAPENTLEAIECAHARGAKAVEFDVGRTRDGHYVLMHDEGVDRTTDHVGPLNQWSLAQVQGMCVRRDASHTWGAPEDVVRVPTLEQALRVSARLGLMADVEVKEDVDPQELAQQLGPLMDELNLWGRVWVSSFYPQHLHALRLALPKLVTAINVGIRVTPNPAVNTLLASQWLHDFLGVSIVKPEHPLVTPERLRLWRGVGKAVMVWTVNTAAQKRRAREHGVALITDCVGTTCASRAHDA